MNRNWIFLVVIGVVVMIAIVGWDIFATFAGYKTEFSFKITEVENRLFGPVEDHLLQDPNFTEFQVEISDTNFSQGDDFNPDDQGISLNTPQ